MNFEPGKWVYVCSNHFVDGEPTSANPNPTLYLRQTDRQKKSPSKRRRLPRESHNKENDIVEIDNDEEEIDSIYDFTQVLSMEKYLKHCLTTQVLKLQV